MNRIIYPTWVELCVNLTFFSLKINFLIWWLPLVSLKCETQNIDNTSFLMNQSKPVFVHVQALSQSDVRPCCWTSRSVLRRIEKCPNPIIILMSHLFFSFSSYPLLRVVLVQWRTPQLHTCKIFPDIGFFAAKWIEFQPSSINSHKTPHCSVLLFKTAFYTIEEYFSKYAKLRHHSAQFGQISSRPLSKWKLPTRRWLG